MTCRLKSDHGSSAVRPCGWNSVDEPAWMGEVVENIHLYVRFYGLWGSLMIENFTYKRIIYLLVVISLLLCNTSFVFAEVARLRPIGFEFAPCSLYQFHKMGPSSAGWVFDKDTGEKLFGGGLYKCDCGAVVICEGRPEIGGALGKYITTSVNSIQADFKRKPYGFDLYNWPTFNWAYVSPSDVCYTNSNRIEGYRFYRAW